MIQVMPIHAKPAADLRLGRFGDAVLVLVSPWQIGCVSSRDGIHDADPDDIETLDRRAF